MKPFNFVIDLIIGILSFLIILLCCIELIFVRVPNFVRLALIAMGIALAIIVVLSIDIVIDKISIKKSMLASIIAKPILLLAFIGLIWAIFVLGFVIVLVVAVGSEPLVINCGTSTSVTEPIFSKFHVAIAEFFFFMFVPLIFKGITILVDIPLSIVSFVKKKKQEKAVMSFIETTQETTTISSENEN